MNKQAQAYISVSEQVSSWRKRMKLLVDLMPNDIRLVVLMLLILAVYSSVYGHLAFVIWDMGFALQQLLLLLWLPYNCWRLYRLKGQDDCVCCCQDRRQIALRKAYLSMRVRLGVASVFVIALGVNGVYLCGLSLPLQVSTCWLFSVSAFAMIALEFGFLCWMLSKLRQEYWVQVVDDQGMKIGSVPSSQISEVSGGRLSQVRLLAISSNLVYLERRTQDGRFSEVYDTPLVSWQMEGMTSLQTAQSMIDARFCGIRRVYPRELLHYHSRQELYQVYSHLYTVYISEPSLLQIDCKPIEGKWWSLGELREQMQRDPKAFSPALLEEMPLLEQTVLLAQKLN